RLDDFQVIGNASGESVTRLCERLLRQINGTLRDLDLLGGRFQVEQSVANILINLPAYIGQLRLRLPQTGFGLQDVPMNLATLKNRNIQRTKNCICGKHAARRGSNLPVVGGHIESWKISRN